MVGALGGNIEDVHKIHIEPNIAKVHSLNIFGKSLALSFDEFCP